MVLSVVVLTRNQSTWERKARGHLPQQGSPDWMSPWDTGDPISKQWGCGDGSVSTEPDMQAWRLEFKPQHPQKSWVWGHTPGTQCGEVEAGGSLLLTGQPA